MFECSGVSGTILKAAGQTVVNECKTKGTVTLILIIYAHTASIAAAYFFILCGMKLLSPMTVWS